MAPGSRYIRRITERQAPSGNNARSTAAVHPDERQYAFRCQPSITATVTPRASARIDPIIRPTALPALSPRVSSDDPFSPRRSYVRLITIPPATANTARLQTMSAPLGRSDNADATNPAP